MNDIDSIIRTITVYLIPVLFAISVREAAKGYVARYFGDPSAEQSGRLSFNPIRHIDLFGSIVLPVLLYFAIHVPFGYAKPLPIDLSRLRNPKKHMVYVALAGPVANFVMAFVWMVMLVVLKVASIEETFFIEMARAGVSVNAAICIFNLIPIPPLDGGRIVVGLLPLPLAREYVKLENYGLYVFIALIVLMQLRVLDGVMIAGINAIISLLLLLVSPLTLFLN